MIEGSVAKEPDNRPAHQENVASAGFVSGEWMDLVHTPAKLQDALKSIEP